MSDNQPVSIHVALARVAADIDAVEKGKKSSQGYDYRGIDAVLNALHGPLTRHGVTILPSVEDREVVPSPGAKEGWQDVRLMVSYLFVGPAGDTLTARVCATGRDNSDKGDGKALSYAFKLMAFQVFSLPTDAAEDNEADDGRVDDGRETGWHGWPSEAAHKAAREEVAASHRALPDQAKAAVAGEMLAAGIFDDSDRGPRPRVPLTVAEVDQWRRAVLTAPIPPPADAGTTRPVSIYGDPAAPGFNWAGYLASVGVDPADAVKQAAVLAADLERPAPADLADCDGELGVTLHLWTEDVAQKRAAGRRRNGTSAR